MDAKGEDIDISLLLNFTFFRLFPDQPPGILHMFSFGVDSADGHAQNHLAIEFGVGEIDFARLIEGIHQGHVFLIAAIIAEADKVQGRHADQLKVVIFKDPGGKFLGDFYVLFHMVTQTLKAIMTQDKPELDGPETASKEICQSR